jgi:drug/metabolite transporter, DME family
MEHALRRDSYSRGVVMVALAGTLWGTIGPATAAIFQLATTTPLSVSFLRVLIATPIMTLVAWRMLGAQLFTVSRRDLAVMMLIGALTGISQTCYLIGISLAGVTIPTLVAVCIAPLSVALMSLLLGYERFNLKVMTALLFALIGTVLVVGVEPGTTPSSNLLIGVLFSIASGLTYAGIIICGRFLLARKVHPLQVNTISLASNSVLLLVIGLLTSGLHTSYPPAGWLLFLFLGAVPTALGYVLFLNGMRTTPATITGIITLLEPLTAALLAWVFFGERLTALGIVGAALLLGAIVVLARE